MALQLKRRGLTRVRPLEGGLAGWMARNFPVEARPAPVIPALNASRAGSPPPPMA